MQRSRSLGNSVLVPCVYSTYKGVLYSESPAHSLISLRIFKSIVSYLLQTNERRFKEKPSRFTTPSCDTKEYVGNWKSSLLPSLSCCCLIWRQSLVWNQNIKDGCKQWKISYFWSSILFAKNAKLHSMNTIFTWMDFILGKLSVDTWKCAR